MKADPTWSYGLRKYFKRGSVLITRHEAENLGCKPKVITFTGPPCRTLADMSELEILALEYQYGCPIILGGRS